MCILDSLPFELLASVFCDNSKKCSLVSRGMGKLVRLSCMFAWKQEIETAQTTRSTVRVVSCIRRFYTFEILCKGCAALNNLASQFVGFGDEYRDICKNDGEKKEILYQEYSRIADEGGVGVVLGAMKIDEDNEPLFVDCCSFLAYVLRAKVNHSKVQNKGIFSMISNIMARQATSSASQVCACRVLCNLSSSEVLLGEGDVPIALTAVLEAMSHHPIDNDVQALGCDVLCNMSNKEDLRNIANERGAVESVVATMTRNLGNARVQSSGCGALCNLVIGISYNVTRYWLVLRAGGLDRGRAALKAHPDDAYVQKNGKKLVGMFGSGPTYVGYMSLY